MNNQTSSSVTRCATFEVRFGGFEGLPARKGRDFVESPEVTCFGHRWSLRVFPGGNVGSDDGNAAAFLKHKSDRKFEVQASFIVIESNTKIAAYMGLEKRIFGPVGSSDSSWGVSNFAKRSNLISALREGTLNIEVQMKQTNSTNPPCLPFFPENPLSENILKMFMEQESADVVFEVGEQATSTSNNKAKLSPTTFHAHRFILRASSPILAELCKSTGNLIPIPLYGITPEIFRHLLHYVYGGRVDYETLKAHAKDFIDAADKYEIINLKLEAEAMLVASTVITVDNVVELILYSVDRNCALLREAVMDFLVENRHEAIERLSFENVPGQLMKDLLIAVTADDSMRVDTLRKRLHEKGLYVDGSREAMHARLEENL